MGQHPEVPKTVATLLKKQKGKCAHCELHFTEQSVMEIDHIIPKSTGGKNEYNIQLLHRHCHDKKTASDGSSGTKSGCNSAKPKSTSKFSHLDYNKVWNKGVNGEAMTPEEQDYFRLLVN